ncbi:MAG: hypothetical protein ACPGVU_23480 [Limisphaerales bacterium]
MDNKTVYKWVEEVQQRCRFVDMAHDQLRVSLNEQLPEKVFYDVHALLGHVLALHGMFWPKRQSSLPRGDKLRQELKVADASPLNIHNLRGHLAADDESFEDWLTGLRDPNFVDFNLMPVSAMSGMGTDTFQRNLDPENLQMTYRGASCDLKQFHDETRALQTTIERWKREHTPW